MKDLSPQQTAFLLRIWRSNSEWRISLENPLTGERKGFSKLDAFVEFLRNDMDQQRLTKEEDSSQSDSNS